MQPWKGKADSDEEWSDSEDERSPSSTGPQSASKKKFMHVHIKPQDECSSQVGVADITQAASKLSLDPSCLAQFNERRLLDTQSVGTPRKDAAGPADSTSASSTYTGSPTAFAQPQNGNQQQAFGAATQQHAGMEHGFSAGMAGGVASMQQTQHAQPVVAAPVVQQQPQDPFAQLCMRARIALLVLNKQPARATFSFQLLQRILNEEPDAVRALIHEDVFRVVARDLPGFVGDEVAAQEACKVVLSVLQTTVQQSFAEGPLASDVYTYILLGIQTACRVLLAPHSTPCMPSCTLLQWAVETLNNREGPPMGPPEEQVAVQDLCSVLRHPDRVPQDALAWCMCGLLVLAQVHQLARQQLQGNAYQAAVQTSLHAIQSLQHQYGPMWKDVWSNSKVPLRHGTAKRSTTDSSGFGGNRSLKTALSTSSGVMLQLPQAASFPAAVPVQKQNETALPHVPIPVDLPHVAVAVVPGPHSASVWMSEESMSVSDTASLGTGERAEYHDGAHHEHAVYDAHGSEKAKKSGLRASFGKVVSKSAKFADKGRQSLRKLQQGVVQALDTNPPLDRSSSAAADSALDPSQLDKLSNAAVDSPCSPLEMGAHKLGPFAGALQGPSGAAGPLFASPLGQSAYAATAADSMHTAQAADSPQHTAATQHVSQEHTAAAAAAVTVADTSVGDAVDSSAIAAGLERDSQVPLRAVSAAGTAVDTGGQAEEYAAESTQQSVPDLLVWSSNEKIDLQPQELLESAFDGNADNRGVDEDWAAFPEPLATATSSMPDSHAKANEQLHAAASQADSVAVVELATAASDADTHNRQPPRLRIGNLMTSAFSPKPKPWSRMEDASPPTSPDELVDKLMFASTFDTAGDKNGDRAKRRHRRSKRVPHVSMGGQVTEEVIRIEFGRSPDQSPRQDAVTGPQGGPDGAPDGALGTLEAKQISSPTKQQQTGPVMVHLSASSAASEVLMQAHEGARTESLGGSHTRSRSHAGIFENALSPTAPRARFRIHLRNRSSSSRSSAGSTNELPGSAKAEMAPATSLPTSPTAEPVTTQGPTPEGGPLVPSEVPQEGPAAATGTATLISAASTEAAPLGPVAERAHAGGPLQGPLGSTELPLKGPRARIAGSTLSPRSSGGVVVSPRLLTSTASSRSKVASPRSKLASPRGGVAKQGVASPRGGWDNSTTISQGGVRSPRNVVSPRTSGKFSGKESGASPRNAVASPRNKSVVGGVKNLAIERVASGRLSTSSSPRSVAKTASEEK